MIYTKVHFKKWISFTYKEIKTKVTPIYSGKKKLHNITTNKNDKTIYDCLKKTHLIFHTIDQFSFARLDLLPLNCFVATNVCDQIAVTTIKQRPFRGEKYSQRFGKKSQKFLAGE